MKFNVALFQIIAFSMIELSKCWKPDKTVKSICHEYYEVQKSLYETYYEAYYEKFLGIFKRRKARVNYRIKYYTKLEPREVCCNGYVKLLDTCVPVCTDYTNGVRYNNDRSNVCQPICENGCEHGTCVLPSVCTCDSGYQKDERGHCEPICDPLCINGTCTEPYLCTCDEGYVLRNGTICEPFCQSVCPNGTCVGPNDCHCNEGYHETKENDLSTCVVTCSRNCSDHGTCINEREPCLCYFGWSGWDCEEMAVCVYKTTVTSTLLASVTVINETNATLMETYDNAPLCYQCSDSLDNETLCLAVQSDESLTIPTVGCFLNAELPCYKRPHYNTLETAWGMTEYLIGITIGTIAIAGILGCAIIHRRRSNQRTMPVTVQESSSRDTNTEILII